MFGIDMIYPITGLVVLAGSIAFLKVFDYLAGQSAKRLFEMPGAVRTENDSPAKRQPAQSGATPMVQSTSASKPHRQKSKCCLDQMFSSRQRRMIARAPK
jgi:hypothetical protein